MKRWIFGGVVLAAVAGVAYLATLGCCQLMRRGEAPKVQAISDELNLTPDQRRQVASLEKDFMSRKEASCGVLCAKRAQMIQLFKQREPDRTTLYTLTEEIGREQTALEKATIEHLLALRNVLDEPQKERLVARVSERLRTACEATACGSTTGCFMEKKGNR